MKQGVLLDLERSLVAAGRADYQGLDDIDAEFSALCQGSLEAHLDSEVHLLRVEEGKCAYIYLNC